MTNEHSGDREAEYLAIFDTANDAVFVHDVATGAILAVNQKMVEMYGYSRDEAMRLAVEDLSAGIAPHTQARAFELMQRAIAGTPQLFEWSAKHRSGRLFWVEVNLKHVVIGGRHRLLAIVRDISERKRSEQQIRDSHEGQKTLNALLRLALEDLGLEDLLQQALTLVLHSTWPVTLGVGAVFLVDERAGELVLKAHHGLDSQIQQRCARLPLGHCLCGRVARSGQGIHCETVDARHETTYAGITPHGHYCVPIVAGGTVLGVLNVYLAAGHPRAPAEEEFFGSFASTLAGIIVRKRSEESLRAADAQLREQATLVTLGEMAAVVAHEVRNPLAGVRVAIQMIGRQLPSGGEDAGVIEEIVARLDALEQLMKDLLLFARPPRVHLEPVEILALVERASVHLSQDPTMRSVFVEVEGSPSVVMVDPQLLEIVLLNLFLNAAQAMNHDGTIRTLVVADDRTCRIAVADRGPGIPSEIRDRVFSPFFTTKPRGTGLGLPTARRLVDIHHGRISVECPPEGGTTVTIELPREPRLQHANY